MVSIDADMLPATSIGGVDIGSRMQDLLADLSQADIEFTARTFSNFGKEYQEISVNDYGMTVVGNSKGNVVRVSCRNPYKGRYNEAYFPGMTVAQLIDVSAKVLVIHGMIVVNGEFGIMFDIPEVLDGKQYDDVDYVEQLPPEMRLEEIHVQDREWWR